MAKTSAETKALILAIGALLIDGGLQLTQWANSVVGMVLLGFGALCAFYVLLLSALPWLRQWKIQPLITRRAAQTAGSEPLTKGDLEEFVAGFEEGLTGETSKPIATPKWATEQIQRSLSLGEHKGWDELQQAARLGQVTVWGRPQNSTHRPLEIIPPDHWRDYHFDYLRCEFGAPADCATEPYNDRTHLRGEGYRELSIDKDQVMAKWPAQRSDGPLQISVGDGSLYSIGSAGRDSRTLYTIDRRYGAALENHDRAQSIRDCKLAVQTIDPYSGHSMPRVLASGLTINPGDRILVPLALFHERRDGSSTGSGDTIIVIGPTTAGEFGADLDNTLTLRATALDVAPFEIRCRVWVENDKLHVAKI